MICVVTGAGGGTGPAIVDILFEKCGNCFQAGGGSLPSFGDFSRLGECSGRIFHGPDCRRGTC